MNLFTRVENFTSTPHLVAVVILSWCTSAGGCASRQGPQVLHISSARYSEAFDAALEVARTSGMPPALRDRRLGIIETEPAIAGSILEPWRSDNASLEQALENTITFQRRRARFEFVAAEALPSDASEQQVSSEPDLFSTRPSGIDLSEYAGDLELRVWVYIERASAPGVRRSTWTRHKTTRATIVAPSSNAGRLPPQLWAPVSRDDSAERRLLGAIDRALQRSLKRPGGVDAER